MIFLQLWWTLMVLTGSNTLSPQCQKQQQQLPAGSEKLRSFHHAVTEARKQLHEIHSSQGAHAQNADQFRNKRNNIDDLLESFVDTDHKELGDKDDKDLQQAADDWFRDFQAGIAPMEAARSASGLRTKHSRAAHAHFSNYDKAMEATAIGKVKKKYKDLSEQQFPAIEWHENQPFKWDKSNATPLDIKLKHVQSLLHNQELKQEFDKPKVEFKPIVFDNSPVPDGVYERTLARLHYNRLKPNNLSHEANYKLSKIEQEASERATKMRYSNGLQKRSSSLNGFNPMNEIKLKTSSRLMSKGLGPSLPSNGLADTLRGQYMDDLLMHNEQKLQRQQERKEEEGEVDEKPMQLSRYEVFDSYNGPSGSKYGSSRHAEHSNMRVFDMPQSYDYRQPHYDQFHTKNQRTFPNMQDYTLTRVKGNLLGERYKRQPGHVKEPESMLKLTDNGSKLDQLDAKIQAGKNVKLEAEAKPAQELVKSDEPQLKALVKPDVASIGEAKVERPANEELKSSHSLATKSELIEPVDAQVKQEAESKSDNKNLIDAKADVDAKSELLGNLHSDKELENTLLKDEKTIVKVADSAPTAQLKARTATCKVNPDAVVKLLANKLSQHSNDKDRDKRNIQHWTWRQFHHQKAHHTDNLVKEPTRLKRRCKRSVEQLPAKLKTPLEPQTKPLKEVQLDAQLGLNSEPQLESQLDAHKSAMRSAKLLDAFEDHNGNRTPLGSLGNALFTQDATNVEENSFSNSRYQVPMLAHRNSNMAYPQQQHYLYQQQTLTPQQQLQQQPWLQPQVMHYQPLPLLQKPLPQRQLMQELQLMGNTKQSFNLSQFLQELCKTQQQQQPQQPQQPQQLQQQEPPACQPEKSQQQSEQNVQQPDQQHVQQQRAPEQQKAREPQSSVSACGIHHYFGPLFNKGGKVTTTTDPCQTKTTSKPSASNPKLSTIDPDCVPITSSHSNSTAAGNAKNLEEPIKLNISINANMYADPKTEQMKGNASINMMPAKLQKRAYIELQSAQLDDELVEPNLAKEDRCTREITERGKDVKEKRRSKVVEKDDNGDKKEMCEKSDKSDKTVRKDKQAKSGKSKKSKKPGKTDKTAKNQEKKSDKTGSTQKKNKPAKTTTNCFNENSEPLDNYDRLLSGKVSEDIVHAVFDMVSNDPTMDPLVSVLARNRKISFKRPKYFYQLRSEVNEQQLEQTENMVRQTMESISTIIDKQMRKRACIPLRPDLVEFYELIMRTLAEQQKYREKRAVSLRALSDGFQQELRDVDAKNIEQKSRIVKKLLRQYDELPLEDQRTAIKVRDELLMDLIYLRKMSDTVERTRRTAQLEDILEKTSGTEASDKQLFNDYSPRFIKLLKTAEIFKAVGEQQARNFIGV